MDDNFIRIPDGDTLFDMYELDVHEIPKQVPEKCVRFNGKPFDGMSVSNVSISLYTGCTVDLSIANNSGEDREINLVNKATVYYRARERCIVLYRVDVLSPRFGIANDEVATMTVGFERGLYQQMVGF